MKNMVWLLLAVFVVGSVVLILRARRKMKERERAAAERFAAFMAATAAVKKPADAAAAPVAPPATPLPVPAAPTAGDGLPQQKLLFEAAHKAGEAGEPALAIQLYARLLARYPASAFAPQVRAAVEAQKKKLGKA